MLSPKDIHREDHPINMSGIKNVKKNQAPTRRNAPPASSFKYWKLILGALLIIFVIAGAVWYLMFHFNKGNDDNNSSEAAQKQFKSMTSSQELSSEEREAMFKWLCDEFIVDLPSNIQDKMIGTSSDIDGMYIHKETKTFMMSMTFKELTQNEMNIATGSIVSGFSQRFGVNTINFEWKTDYADDERRRRRRLQDGTTTIAQLSSGCGDKGDPCCPSLTQKCNDPNLLCSVQNAGIEYTNQFGICGIEGYLPINVHWSCSANAQRLKQEMTDIENNIVAFLDANRQVSSIQHSVQRLDTAQRVKKSMWNEFVI